MKSFLPKKPVYAERAWLVLDAANQPLGRLAVKAADLLRGKNKTTFTPSVDMGDFVVVINAEKVKLTGKKEDKKIYQFFSGYRHGQKEIPARQLREKHPTWLVTIAVRRMLPKSRTGRKLLRRLKVYAGDKHPHGAQKATAAEKA